jgi:nickel superoxide dismutase
MHFSSSKIPSLRAATWSLVLAAGLLFSSASAWAHCEIPCGIYGDDLRFSLIEENLTTVEKSMQQIEALSGDPANINQLTRWVNNKEVHADQIREIVTQYFLTQRIKIPADGDGAAYKAYSKKVVLLHQMMVYAMKCKQTTDVANVKKLHDLAHEFKGMYQAK